MSILARLHRGIVVLPALILWAGCTTGGGGGGGGGDPNVNANDNANVNANDNGTPDGGYDCGGEVTVGGGGNELPHYDLLPAPALPRSIRERERPAQIDLSAYVPTPCNQQTLNSCVAWAGAYGLMTYLAAENINGWMDLDRSDRHFSPTFIFNQVNAYRLGRSQRSSCMEAGTYLTDLFTLLRDTGCATWAEVPYTVDDCETQPSTTALDQAADYRISYFRAIERDVSTIQAYLDQRIPVVAVVRVGVAAGTLSPGEVYDSAEAGETYAHAVLVVGYDNSLGALKIMNSWGTEWGDGGFGFVSYDAWEDIASEAYVVGNELVTSCTSVSDEGVPKSGRRLQGVGARDCGDNPLLDTDGDGYPDTMELEFAALGLDPLVPNDNPDYVPPADADGDAWADATEQAFGTAADDPTDFPFLCGYEFPSGFFEAAGTITLSTTSLEFTGLQNGPNPPAQTVQLTNTGTGTLNWQVTDDAAWLSVAPVSGSVATEAATLTVGVDLTGLTAAASPYTASIVVSSDEAGNSPQVVNVTLTIGTDLTECQPLDSTEINIDTTLAAGCYLAESTVYVSNNATLTIAPGTTLQFAQSAGLVVEIDGTLSAIGTAEEPIVFTGRTPTRGYWGGLWFDDSGSADNRLDHVTVEYGGGSWYSAYANVVLTGSSQVAITNSILRESSEYGLALVGDSAALSEFAENTLTANALGAGSVDASAAGYLDDSTTYTGNDVDLLRISGSLVTTDQTWPGIDVPYLVPGIVYVQAPLTIAPGAMLQFAQGAGLEVETSGTLSGSLSAIGTAEDPIVFTGQQATRGYWGGLWFDNSNSVDNRLDHATVEYGGGNWYSAYANVVITGSSQVAITNSILRESSEYGLALVGGSAALSAFADNTLTANALGAASVDASAAGYLDDGSTYTGNDVDLLRISSSYVTTAQSWPGIDVPYLVPSIVYVRAPLTIAPGATLQFTQSAGLVVEINASLSAIGTAEDPIVFTGQQPTPGYWGGLHFANSNSLDNRLDHVTVEYGGGVWYSAYANVVLTRSSLVGITNAIIQESDGWGIWVGNDATLTTDDAGPITFANNALGDAYFEP